MRLEFRQRKAGKQRRGREKNRAAISKYSRASFFASLPGYLVIWDNKSPSLFKWPGVRGPKLETSQYQSKTEWIQNLWQIHMWNTPQHRKWTLVHNTYLLEARHTQKNILCACTNRSSRRSKANFGDKRSNSGYPVGWGRDWQGVPGSLRTCWKTGYMGVFTNKEASSCTLQIHVLYCMYTIPQDKNQLFIIRFDWSSKPFKWHLFIHSFIKKRTWGFPI